MPLELAQKSKITAIMFGGLNPYDIPTMISFKGLMLRNLSLQLRKTLGLRRELGIEGAQIERIAGVFLEREKFGKELLFTLGIVEWIFFERIGIEIEK